MCRVRLAMAPSWHRRRAPSTLVFLPQLKVTETTRGRRRTKPISVRSIAAERRTSTRYTASAADTAELADAQARDAENLAREKANEADAAKKLADARSRRAEIEMRML